MAWSSPRSRVSQWRFFAGTAGGRPRRSPKISDKQPVLTDIRRLYLPDPADNIARTGAGVTPIEKSAHYGHWQYYNDGNTAQSEDSYDNSPKPADWWGYTFDTSYNFDRAVYTTGNMSTDGGWFSASGGGLQVQVRQDFQWVNVTGLRISPDYPYNQTAGPNKTYTMTFDKTWGDGIRITGAPGGGSSFTSIAELEAYYTG